MNKNTVIKMAKKALSDIREEERDEARRRIKNKLRQMQDAAKIARNLEREYKDLLAALIED